MIAKPTRTLQAVGICSKSWPPVKDSKNAREFASVQQCLQRPQHKYFSTQAFHDLVL